MDYLAVRAVTVVSTEPGPVRWYGRPWRLDQRPINPLPLAISRRWEKPHGPMHVMGFLCGPDPTRATRAGDLGRRLPSESDGRQGFGGDS